jgi:tetraacyldisaccharide-1-P 4'-kinase
VFLTQVESLTGEELSFLKKQIQDIPVVLVRYGLSFHRCPKGENVPVDDLKGARLLAVSGLGQPASFEESLRGLGADVAPQRFPDHHFFTPKDLAFIKERAIQEDRIVIVTEKDWVRLPADFVGLVARLDWIPDEGDRAWIEKINSVIS